MYFQLVIYFDTYMSSAVLLVKDFGSIFSTLLPGAKAKLVAPEGLSILDGLEFKVAFGDAWKESLGELSGGQRYVECWGFCRSVKTGNIHTYIHPFNGPFSGTTRLSRYQKGKTNLDFTEAIDSEWQ